jgi:hypothetical protein
VPALTWDYVPRTGLSAREQVTGSRADKKSAEARSKGPERFCPNCSAELKESPCNLNFSVCGFYLSCWDFIERITSFAQQVEVALLTDSAVSVYNEK